MSPMTSTNNQEQINDENWSQIRETVLLINVAVARIEHAMIDGEDSVTTLSQSFVEMVNSAKQIILDTEELEDSAAKSKIEKSCLDISQRIQSSIIAFQFYDRLSQRMTHVSKTLSSLSELLDDQTKHYMPQEWLELQEAIRSKYTLDADQKMFDDVLNGMPIQEALNSALNATAEDDIELF